MTNHSLFSFFFSSIFLQCVFSFSEKHLPHLHELDDSNFPLEVVAKFERELNQIVSEHNFGIVSCLRHSPNVCLLRHKEVHHETEKVKRVSLLKREEGIKWVERQVKRRPVPFSGVSEEFEKNPLFKDQWHFYNSFYNYSYGPVAWNPEALVNDVNIDEVWNQGYSGKGVILGIVDDAVDVGHPDFKDKFLEEYSFDFIDYDNDPSPKLEDENHGTSVAGVALARNDKTCGIGAAYNSKFGAFRYLGAYTSDYDLAHTLTYSDNVDILTNSWGFTTPFYDYISPIVQQGLDDAVTHGRNGKGAIITFSAGNLRSENILSNYLGLQSAPETISVAGVGANGVYAYYSSRGSNVLISSPTKDRLRGITTTDRRGSEGYSSDDCTNEFGGTSSSCPLVSGIIALILEASPDLGWRDVQEILARTARKNDPSNSEWQTNGAGLHVNMNYGFGLIDASEAVKMSKRWKNLPKREKIFKKNLKLTSKTDYTNEYKFQVDEQLTVEHVQVKLILSRLLISSCTVYLISPHGTVSNLIEEGNYFYTYKFLSWSFTSVFHWGENSRGNWTLVISGTGDYSAEYYSEMILWGHYDEPKVTVNTTSFCQTKQVMLSWVGGQTTKLVVKKGENEKKYNISGMSSIVISDLDSSWNNSELLFYSDESQNNLETSLVLTLPQCQGSQLIVESISCSTIKVSWEGQVKGSKIVLREVDEGTQIKVDSNINESGSKKMDKPLYGKWVGEVVSSTTSEPFKSNEFEGELCPDVSIEMYKRECFPSKVHIDIVNIPKDTTLYFRSIWHDVGEKSYEFKSRIERMRINFEVTSQESENYIYLTSNKHIIYEKVLYIYSCELQQLSITKKCNKNQIRAEWNSIPVGYYIISEEPFNRFVVKNSDDSVYFENASGQRKVDILNFRYQSILTQINNEKCTGVAPPIVKIKDVSSNSISLKISVPDKTPQPKYYFIKVYEGHFFQKFSGYFKSTNKITISPLLPSLNYNIFVSGYYQGEMSEETNILARTESSNHFDLYSSINQKVMLFEKEIKIN